MKPIFRIFTIILPLLLLAFVREADACLQKDPNEDDTDETEYPNAHDTDHTNYRG